MLLRLLKSPGTSAMWVFRTIHGAVRTEIEAEIGAIRVRLNELYMELEAGALSEDEFDEIEDELLDRLDELEALLEGDG